MGWRKRAITRNMGEKVVVETMKKEGETDYWIIPKKLSVDAMQRITQSLDIDVQLDEKEVEGKTVDQIEALMKERIKSIRNKKSLFSEETINMMKTVILGGVEDHNFDDENGEKMKWDEGVFNELMNYPDTLMEIFRIIMRYNYPLAQKKSGSSVT